MDKSDVVPNELKPERKTRNVLENDCVRVDNIGSIKDHLKSTSEFNDRLLHKLEQYREELNIYNPVLYSIDERTIDIQFLKKHRESLINLTEIINLMIMGETGKRIQAQQNCFNGLFQHGLKIFQKIDLEYVVTDEIASLRKDFQETFHKLLHFDFTSTVNKFGSQLSFFNDLRKILNEFLIQVLEKVERITKFN